MVCGGPATHLIEVGLPRPTHSNKGFGTHQEHIGQAKQHYIIIHELAILGRILIDFILPHACSGRLYIRTSTQIEGRSEEHTSELQSRQYLVCRLLLEKKKNIGQPY